MKLVVLIDNNTFTDDHYFAEPGVCYWIEADGKNILFDTGFSDAYLKNAKKMNIDLEKTDFIVLSHGHNDHTEGLKYFPHPSKRIQLISHPDCLLPKYITDEIYIGSPVDKEEATRNYNYTETKEPYFLTKNIVFLGEIKEKYDHEKREPIGFLKRDGVKEADQLIDDTALAVKTDKGIVIVTGCSHAGICNIIAAAKEAFKERNIHAVIGGFHLREKFKSRLQETARVIKKEVKGTVYPAHCSDFEAKCYLARNLNTEEVFVSKELVF